MTVYLTVDQAIKVHDLLIQQHGGLAGIRDIGLLTSAIEMPKSSFDGLKLHPTVSEKAAAYLFHIIRNHPFCDGNKRTGSFLALLFLRMNNVRFSFDIMQYEILVIGVAENLITKKQVAQFFEKNIKRRKQSKR
jgi:death-on-curing protein